MGVTSYGFRINNWNLKGKKPLASQAEDKVTSVFADPEQRGT